MELERVRQSTAKVGPELHLHFFLVGLDIDLLLCFGRESDVRACLLERWQPILFKPDNSLIPALTEPYDGLVS